jgi:hypothetical protein
MGTVRPATLGIGWMIVLAGFGVGSGSSSTFAESAPSDDPPSDREATVSKPRLPRDELLVFRGEGGEPVPARTTEDWLQRRDRKMGTTGKWGQQENGDIAEWH